MTQKFSERCRSIACSSTLLLLCSYLLGCAPPSPIEELSKVLVSAPASPGVERCKSLERTQLGSALIDHAQPVQKGDHVIVFWKRWLYRALAPFALPDLGIRADFCRVTATLRPTSGSEIITEVWLPDQWNGKFVGTGGGGFSGGLGATALTLLGPLGKGYAGMATDVGHDETDSAKFTSESRQQYEDYAYQGNHVAAGFAKALIATYYGKPTARAYFHGCSNGGRDALMVARRFPEDYDGIIAGAPAAGWSRLMTSFAWNAQAARSAPNLKSKLGTIQAAVIAKCDSLDGVKDQLLENPAECQFEPKNLQCRGVDGPNCLSAEEVSALRRIYGGPRLGDGSAVYAGMPVGGEALPGNWDDWIVKDKSMQASFARESFRWMVRNDPKWDIDQFDIDRDYPAAAESMGKMMDSDDPRLDAFARRGGRLVLYHGWNDAAIPAGATVEFYERLRTSLGSVADTHVRLFMIPGMMHCGGGAGLSDFDVLDYLDRWIETGNAPDRIIARQYDPPAVFGPAQDAKVVRTRPLCAWPTAARYTGSGPSDDAANFNCK